MRKRYWLVFMLCVLLGAGGFFVSNQRLALQTPSEETFAKMFPADSRQVFENADSFVLYSIRLLKYDNTKTFHDHPILGRTEVTDATTRRDLVAHLYNGIATQQNAFDCGQPNHAIRARKGKKTVDLLICFRCGGIQVLYGSKVGRGFTSKIPQKFYDSILIKAGLPLAP